MTFQHHVCAKNSLWYLNIKYWHSGTFFFYLTFFFFFSLYLKSILICFKTKKQVSQSLKFLVLYITVISPEVKTKYSEWMLTRLDSSYVGVSFWPMQEMALFFQDKWSNNYNKMIWKFWRIVIFATFSILSKKYKLRKFCNMFRIYKI